jgi:hypothetical protein
VSDDHSDAPSATQSTSFDPGSYRDPGSRVVHRGGDVLRLLDERALADWERLSATTFFRREVAAGRIVGSEVDQAAAADVPGTWAGALRHERIPVVSYPYEWTFSMLRDAALLQLDLLGVALDEDMILKDSTPFNIQWRGPQPVFIDVGSFERLEKGEVWVGYRQFLQQFLYPLLLSAHVGVPFQPWLRGQPDGLTADQLQRMMSMRNLFRRGGLLHVALPARAERRYREGGRDVRSELKAAGFRKELIQANVRGLRKIVSGLTRSDASGTWDTYAAEFAHVAAQRAAKSEFVTAHTAAHPPRMVWDVGANDGHFSKLAAPHADYVLALDGDDVVLDDLYRALTATGIRNVLPIVQDVANPSPGLGWRNAERPPLAERSTPDLVLCLAVIHHLVVARNIPLRSVLDWLADLDSRVILEYVPPDDPMVRGLTANKRPHEIHADYDEASLRRYLDERFVIEAEQPVPSGSRRLFALRPKG